MTRFLDAYGWDDRWAALLAEASASLGADASLAAARVLRHDGVALAVVGPEGPTTVELTHRIEPEPTVGDWVALAGHEVVGVLPRSSLLRRRSAHGEEEHPLAANLDAVLIVCGLDRPVKTGRIQRSAALATDAGAEPVVVLTKAALADDADTVADDVRAANPGLDVVVTSVQEGRGLDALRSLVAGRTVTLLGESGAGKSSLVNALVGAPVAATGDVRAGDAKGRHTTTTRELHLIPGGGVVVDTPGIRAVGLAVDPEAVRGAFPDIEELAEGCRFGDCAHDTEPGCAVTDAVASGDLAASRLESWRELRAEAEAAALRARPREQRRKDRQRSRAARNYFRQRGDR